MARRVGYLVTVATLSLALASASGAQELTVADSAIIEAGRQVVRAEKVSGSSWPRVTIFQFIAASPEEAAAVFADFERHVHYLPNVKKSAISRVVDSGTVEVDYVLNLPLVSDESYTVRDHITSDSDAVGRSYHVTWTLVRASTTKAADGGADFLPYKEGTLMIYRNLVVPGSRLAGLGFIRSRAQRDVVATARAVAEQVVKQVSSERELLDRQVLALRSALR